MKSLAILDHASLDQAFGGVSRAVSPGQLAQAPRGSSLDIKQLASDFGFALPTELASTIDSVEGLVGQLASGDDAGAWCGSSPAEPSPELVDPALGCTMDVSGAGAYDADDMAAADDGACGEPPACGDDMGDAEIAAEGDVCGTLPPGGSWDEEPAAEAPAVDMEPAGAASASGGVTIGAAVDRGGSTGGWFDIDAGQFAQYADASQPAPMKSAPSLASFDDVELEPAATDRPYSSFAESANVRDHRGR